MHKEEIAGDRPTQKRADSEKHEFGPSSLSVVAPEEEPLDNYHLRQQMQTLES